MAPCFQAMTDAFAEGHAKINASLECHQSGARCKHEKARKHRRLTGFFARVIVPGFLERHCKLQ